jgi:hypothetical protein
MKRLILIGVLLSVLLSFQVNLLAQIQEVSIDVAGMY